EDRYAMQRLAKLLANAIQLGVISEEDLYTTEKHVIARLLSHPQTASEWQHYCQLSKILIGPHHPNAQQINAKKRHINPYVYQQGRTTDLDPSYCAALQAFLSQSFDTWVSGI
ncbi:MAG: hypothetical protein II570_00725, partial [Bacteroidaceae bacterium]|nr:hypothetical protein [Bacteroidaceae bacterium]